MGTAAGAPDEGAEKSLSRTESHRVLPIAPMLSRIFCCSEPQMDSSSRRGVRTKVEDEAIARIR